jgi:hypothetical protein
MSKKQEEKHLKILRSLASLPPNKTCMNCKEKGPVWICLNFDTFVCTTCSGIHREFNHRIKSISMATFTPEEIKRLQESNANEYARKVWLGKWSSSEFPVPEAGDRNRIKEFIKLCYQDKKWYKENIQPTNNKDDDEQLPPQQPISTIMREPPSLVVKTNESTKKREDDLLTGFDNPQSAPTQPNQDPFNVVFNNNAQAYNVASQQPLNQQQDKYAATMLAVKTAQLQQPQQPQQPNPWGAQPQYVAVQQTPWGYQPTGMTYPPQQFQQFPPTAYPGQQFQQFPVQTFPAQSFVQQPTPQTFSNQPFIQQPFQPFQQPQFQSQPSFTSPAAQLQPQAQHQTPFMSGSSLSQDPQKGADKFDAFSSLSVLSSSNAQQSNNGNPFGSGTYANKPTQQQSTSNPFAQNSNPFAPTPVQQQKQPFNPFA